MPCRSFCPIWRIIYRGRRSSSIWAGLPYSFLLWACDLFQNYEAESILHLQQGWHGLRAGSR